MKKVIYTTELTKVYKKIKCVNNVNLTVNENSIYGFLGPNGAGKTTTIRMLLGLINATNGNINIFNQDLKKHKLNILSKVGSLVEYPSYYGHLTAYENLKLVCDLLEIPKKNIDNVLKIIRLNADANKLVKNYSLGMKQRLGIALALINSPKLLILDEPTNGLDPSGIHEIRELIKSLPKEYGMTVFISSHMLSEIEQVATDVGIICKGSLIFQGSLEELQKKKNQKLKIVLDNPKEALKIFYEKGLNADLDKNSILTQSFVDFNKSSDIIKTLVLKGFNIYRVEEEKKSLEDIFLDLTERGASL